MKNRLLVFLGVCILSGCANYRYLPGPRDLDKGIYGSRIQVQGKGFDVTGELIMVDEYHLTILQAKGKCAEVQLKAIKRFNLRYANSAHYEWAPATVLALPLINGYWSALTIPIHLAVTLPVLISSKNAYTYTQRHISFQQLSMFARFPQGMPRNVDCNMLIAGSLEETSKK